MKGFERENRWFSLCGLNCALCPMYLGKYCPGCGQGEGNQSCAIARCSLEHDKVEYCFLCKEYPCSKYQNIDEADSFITHQNQKKDIEKARTIGIKAYCDEQKRKEQILHFLLEQFNDGRKKTLYSTADKSSGRKQTGGHDLPAAGRADFKTAAAGKGSCRVAASQTGGRKPGNFIKAAKSI